MVDYTHESGKQEAAIHPATINVPNGAYPTTQKRSERDSFGCIENDDRDNYDHLFTPEVVADLRSIAAEIEAGGKTYSSEEVREHFVQKRMAWLANHPN